MKPENKKILGGVIRLCDVFTMGFAVYACLWFILFKEVQIGMAFVLIGWLLSLSSGKIRRVLKSENDS